MATKRHKKRMKKQRERTRWREVINKIQKFSKKIAIDSNFVDESHWNEVAKYLTQNEIEIGIEYASRHELFVPILTAMENALAERIIGLTS